MIPYEFKVCDRKEVGGFIEENHYSHNINGVISDHCFCAVEGGVIVMAAIFGRLAMANVWKKFGDCEGDVIELRRLVGIDETPRNTESWFIGNCLRWLRRNTTIKVVVSYADEEYGHTGVIYKASNFKLEYKTPPQRVIKDGDKLYHDKAIRTKYKGELKPFAKRLVARLESGEAKYIMTKGKFCYTFKLK